MRPPSSVASTGSTPVEGIDQTRKSLKAEFWGGLIMKKILLLAVGATLATSSIPVTASASTWHTSSIPSQLRGYWYARDNRNEGVHIYKHSIHYKGEETVKVKWRYAGNHKYHFKYSHSQGFTISMHYYNHHKMTLNSYWHNYVR